MKRFSLVTMMLVASAFFAACEPPASNTGTNKAANTTNTNAAMPVAAAPTKEALMALEKSAYEAWKNKDAKFWDPFLTDNFVGYGMAGRLDKAAAIKEYSGADCDVKSVAFSDEKMTALGSDVAFITYKTTVDGTCGGQKLPVNSWAAGVYVRSGDKWKGAFHAELPIADPNAAPAKPAAPAKNVAAETKPATDAKPDPLVDALMAVENKGWEAWKARDAKGLEAVMVKDFIYLTPTGPQGHAEAIKSWTEPKCDIKSFSLVDPIAVQLSKDVALITYKGNQQGVCDGKPQPAYQWVAALDMKEGDAWKNAFYMNIDPK